jgi:hypothetical protein
MSSARIAYDIVDQALSYQSGEDYRRCWIPWLARTTALAVPALAHVGAPGPAVSRLEQARTRILTERFHDDLSDLDALPPDLRSEVADPIARNPRTPGARPPAELLEPEDLLRTLGDHATVYLAPGRPHGVAILGGGSLGEMAKRAVAGCVPDPEPVARFLEVVMSPSAPAGARRRAVEPVTRWLGEAVWRPIAPLLLGVDPFG